MLEFRRDRRRVFNRSGLIATTQVLTSIVTVTALFALLPVSANASCNPNRGSLAHNYLAFSLWNIGSGNVGGAGANIQEYYPYVYAGESVAWSMIDRGTANWAQVGWDQFSGTTRYLFMQHTYGGQSYTLRMGALGGSINRYTVTSNNANLTVSYYDNGSLITTDNVDWTADTAQFASEITNQANQVAGGRNSPEMFTNSKVYSNSAGAWVIMGGSAGNTNGAISGSVDGQNGQEETWDQACAS